MTDYKDKSWGCVSLRFFGSFIVAMGSPLLAFASLTMAVVVGGAKLLK